MSLDIVCMDDNGVGVREHQEHMELSSQEIDQGSLTNNCCLHKWKWYVEELVMVCSFGTLASARAVA